MVSGDQCVGDAGRLVGVARLDRSTRAQAQIQRDDGELVARGAQVSHGGFDRQLAGVPGCPNMASLKADGITGTMFVHELSQVRPGAGPEYLAAMREEWLPVAREYGHEPVGLYEVMMNDTEVVTVWASDIDSIVKLARTADACRGLDDEVEADDRVGAWRRRAREFCTRWREELMVPCPGTICCDD